MENPYQFDTSSVRYNTLRQIKENMELSHYNCIISYGNKIFKRKYSGVNVKMSKIKLT